MFLVIVSYFLRIICDKINVNNGIVLTKGATTIKSPFEKAKKPNRNPMETKIPDKMKNLAFFQPMCKSFHFLRKVMMRI